MLLLALMVAVASLTAVGFFTSRVARAVNQQAGEVLAADLRLESARTIDEAYDREAARRGLRVARILSMPSVVFLGEDSSLIALRAASEGYPLRGRLKVADRPFGPARVAEGIPAPRRGLGRFEAAREPRRDGRVGVVRGRRDVSRHARARLSAGPGCGLRRSVVHAADQHGRRARDGADPAGQPGQPGSAVRRQSCRRRGLPRVPGRRTQEGRTAAVGGRREPADPRVFGSGRPLPVPREHRERAAVGDRGRHGSPALRAASPRQRRADEVHGRLAGLRAAADAAAARGRGSHRDRGAARSSGTSRSRASPGCCAISSAACCRRPPPTPSGSGSSRPSRSWSGSRCRRCCS